MMPIVMPPNKGPKDKRHLAKEQRAKLRAEFRRDLAEERGELKPLPLAWLVCKIFGHAPFKRFERFTPDGTPYLTDGCSRCHHW